MLPCPVCACHVLPADPHCPHCGAARRLSPGASALQRGLLALCALVGASACAPDSTGEGEEGQEGQTVTTQVGTEATETAKPPPETSSTTTGEQPGEDTETETGTQTFVPNVDIEAVYGECDPFAQDCPEGEKCVPYSSVGGEVFDANKCVPIQGEQAAGEPCVYGGPVDASDDCDAQSLCYFTVEVGGEPIGTCVPLCMGTLDAPQCEAPSECVIAFEGSLAVCLETCDPLMQDCPDAQACAWTGDAGFNCVPGALELGDACQGLFGQCGPGLMCMDGESLPMCADPSCCSQLCDLAEPMCDGIPGTQCVPILDPMEFPESDVGVCLIP